MCSTHCALKILCHLVIGLAFERSENVRFVMVRVRRALCFIHTSYYSVSDFFFSHSNFYLLLYFACVSNAPSCLLPCNTTLSLFMYRSAFYLAISPYSASINTHNHTHTQTHSVRQLMQYKVTIWLLSKICIDARFTYVQHQLEVGKAYFCSYHSSSLLQNSTYNRNINSQQYTLF